MSVFYHGARLLSIRNEAIDKGTKQSNKLSQSIIPGPKMMNGDSSLQQDLFLLKSDQLMHLVKKKQ